MTLAKYDFATVGRGAVNSKLLKVFRRFIRDFRIVSKERGDTTFRLYRSQELALEEIAAGLDADENAKYLYAPDVPDPDLIIRTSGEVRLSGFLPWQSVYSEYYFCEAYWPAFREIDFLRAIRTYQQRARRFGH